MAIEFKVPHKRTTEYRLYPEDVTVKAELNGRYELPDIEWLITDILTRGQVTPVGIRNDGGLAVLVYGFSRWRAVSAINQRGLSGDHKIQLRCTSVSCNELDAFVMNISENRFRNDVKPIDDAHNIQRLLQRFQLTQDQVADIYFPTAKTEKDRKAAFKFVNDRIALISLTPEAETAVRAGRVTEPAAKAIAKLSSDQQRVVLEQNSEKQEIEPKDVDPKRFSRPAKSKPDSELMRRIGLMFDDISGLLPEADLEYIEVERKLLLHLFEYVEELKK